MDIKKTIRLLETLQDMGYTVQDFSDTYGERKACREVQITFTYPRDKLQENPHD